MSRTTAWIWVSMCALSACQPADGLCRTGSECASGICGSDGMCAEAPSEGGPDGGWPDDGPSPACSAQRNGTITADEVPLAAGLRATYRVATSVVVDTAGTALDDGRRKWSFAGALEGDEDVELALESPNGAWWASSFPSATYAARLSKSSDLLGVFETTDDALLLHGVVSPEGGVLRTELVYEPAVAALSFPLTLGESFATEATVSGLAAGVASYYTENYSSEVVAAGDLVAPYGEFSVLRVDTSMVRTVGLATVSNRTQLYVSECVGTVATLTSTDYETEVDFEEIAEIRRLTR